MPRQVNISRRGRNIERFRKIPLPFKIIGIILLIFFAWFGRTFILGSSTKTPEYQTATAERGTLISSVTASGSIASGNSASITTSATGVVNEVLVGNGDTVTQGQTIATLTLDQSSLQKQTAAWAGYLSAQNNVNAAKAKMDSLQAALFTANQKFVNDAGVQNPKTDDPTYIIENATWLQAESDYNNQKGVISAAEASLSSAWLDYTQTSGTVVAPMSGIVSGLTLTPGMAVTGGGSNSSNSTSSTTSSSSQSYGSIVLENGTPQAVVNLSEIDVTKVKTGQKVTMTLDAFPDKTFTGHVASINTNGLVSSGVTTYPTTISFDTAVSSAYPNMAVSATIITDIKTDVLLVPSSAVQTTNGESTVRVLKNNQPVQITVEVGSSNDTQTEIVSGLHEGDTVVTGSTATSTSQTSQTGSSPFGGTGFGAGGGNIRFQTGGGRAGGFGR